MTPGNWFKVWSGKCWLSISSKVVYRVSASAVNNRSGHELTLEKRILQKHSHSGTRMLRLCNSSPSWYRFKASLRIESFGWGTKLIVSVIFNTLRWISARWVLSKQLCISLSLSWSKQLCMTSIWWRLTRDFDRTTFRGM